MHGKQLRSRAVCLNIRICLQLFRELDTGTILNVHRKTFLADFSYSNVAISKLYASLTLTIFMLLDLIYFSKKFITKDE